MSSGKRYKVNGSTFAVQTGFGASKQITAISKANPAVVTSPANGFVLGTVVQLNDVAGMTQVDGGVYAVDNPMSGSFELAGVDSAGYDTFTPESPTTATAVPVTFSTFCELTSINQQGAGANEIEVTTICSTAKEFEQGLSDSGTLALDYNYAPNQPVQAAMRAAELSGAKLAFKVVFPGDGGTAIMIGSVTSTSFQGAVNDVFKGSASIKLSGEVFVLEAA